MSENQGHEIELKLALRPDDAARIGRLKSLPEARLGLPAAMQIVTVYFDTPAHALRRSGLSLRLRHAGSKRLQTVKSEPLGEGLAAPRLEDEVPLNGVGPDLARIENRELRARVLEAVAQETLAPCFETVILRTTRQLKTQSRALVELVVDQGEIRTAGADAQICELELELKSGAPTALFDLAGALNEAMPLRLLRLSKADRGYALLGEIVDAPRKAKPVTLAPEVTAGEALRIILENCLAQLLANEPAVVDRQEVEGLHQFRVALRRLRAALSTYAPLFPDGTLKALERDIKVLGTICGAARDYDVFLESTLPAADGVLADFGEGRAALARAAQSARTEAWVKTIEAVTSGRFTALILALARHTAGGPALEGRAFEAPARRFAARALDHHLKRTAKLAAEIDDLNDQDRHKLRKRLKRLRYSAEFFAGLFDPEESRSYLKRLSLLQDCFGALNDVATAERLVEGLSGSGPGAEAGARLVVYHRVMAEAMMAEAGERWKKLAKRDPFWRET